MTSDTSSRPKIRPVENRIEYRVVTMVASHSAAAKRSG
jgi:hypothetical protein